MLVGRRAKAQPAKTKANEDLEYPPEFASRANPGTAKITNGPATSGPEPGTLLVKIPGINAPPPPGANSKAWDQLINSVALVSTHTLSL
jgi:hypothetical protein